MMFTWTLLFARAKDLVESGDFYGFMLLVSVIIDAGFFAAFLIKFNVPS